ncbi:MAG TPA: glycosyltransferase [Vicinamibacterales bacterium]
MISIVVPAHNEEALIGATLEALTRGLRALGPPVPAHELIVVDDGSDDRTADIARAAGARVVPVKVRQIAAARNAGAAAASGDLLFFVDADTIVPERTLRASVEAIARGAVAGGAAAALPRSEARWARAAWAPFQWGMVLLRMPGGAFMFMTRAAFEAAGGFDERYFASEEIHLARALKREGRFVMVRPQVITSGRKFRLLGPARMTREWLRLARRGPRALRHRKHLGLWYDKHRD